MQQFPGLQGLGQQQQGGTSLQSLGYQSPGTQFFPGQGLGSIQSLSPFEGAKGMGSESITGGLASGQFGKSASQQQPTGGGLLSLPSLMLPQAQQAQAAAGAGAGGGEPMGAAPSGTGGPGLTDIAGTGQQLYNLFAGPNLGNQTTTPGFAEQRRQERTDYSNATGSPSGVPMPTPISTGPGGNPAAWQGATPGPEQVFGGVDYSNATGSPSGRPVPFGGSEFGGTGGTPGEVMFAPGGSAQQVLGQQPPEGSFMGGLQGVTGAVGGLYNVAGGVQSGSPLQAGMGGLQALGGVTTFLQSNPQLAASMGISQEALSGVGGVAGGALSGLGGLYNLYTGTQTGDPVQLISGLLSAYQGGSQLAGALLGEAAPGLTTLFATIAPETAAALATSLGVQVGADAGATAIGTALGSAVSGAAAGAAPGVAIATIIITSMIDSEKEQAARKSGWWNNPIKGQLYSDATAGVQGANELLAQGGAGGLQGLSTVDLADILTGGVNSMRPYFETAQGGVGSIRASDAAGSPGLQSRDQYTQNAATAQQGLSSVIQELMNRGVTYEQLGQLPVSGDWAQQTLDAAGMPQEYYNMQPGKYGPEGAALLGLASGSFGKNVPEMTVPNTEMGMPTPTGQSQWQSSIPQGQQLDMLQAALGASMQAPSAETNASGLMTSMYGGPLWAAIARMGGGGMQPLISQHFDPWVSARTWSPQQLYQSLNAQLPAGADISAQQGWGSTAGPLAQAPQAQPDFWGPLQQQRAQQTDPATQALMQYMQQLQALQGQLPQLGQAAQQMPTQGLDAGVLAAMQQAPGFTSQAPSAGGGGGLDLLALLKQMGYTT